MIGYIHVHECKRIRFWLKQLSVEEGSALRDEPIRRLRRRLNGDGVIIVELIVRLMIESHICKSRRYDHYTTGLHQAIVSTGCVSLEVASMVYACFQNYKSLYCLQDEKIKIRAVFVSYNAGKIKLSCFIPKRLQAR